MKQCRSEGLYRARQKATDFLTEYYGIRRMKIVVDGRRVGNGNDACYYSEHRIAYFKKKGLDKFNVCHEFYHHLANVRGYEISGKKEEKEADSYAKKILKTSSLFRL